MTAEAALLSTGEHARLASLEAIVAEGLQTFIAVGVALRAIRDERLYRVTQLSEYLRDTP